MITTPDLILILELVPADHPDNVVQSRRMGWMQYLSERTEEPAQEHWIESVMEIVRMAKH